MRKLFLIFATIIAGISCYAQNLEWSEIGRGIASETNASASAVEDSFKSNGMNIKFSSVFNPSTNSVNIIFDYGSVDIISVMNQENLTEFKNSYIDSFIQGILSESGDDDLFFAEHVKIMEKGNGEYRLILKGNGNQKVMRITPEDLKRIATRKYGMKF